MRGLRRHSGGSPRKGRSRPEAPPSPDFDWDVRTTAPYVEWHVADPAALEEDWNYTDRALRLTQEGFRLFGRAAFAEAAQRFQAALRSDRYYPTAAAACIEALVALGDLDWADALSEAMLRRFSACAEVGAARAHVFFHLGDLDQALTFADTATRLAPDAAYPWLISGEARLGLSGAMQAASDHFRLALKAATSWPDLDVRIGLAYMEWGHPEHALESVIGKERRLDTLPALGWIVLGDAHRRLGERRHARTCYRKAAALAPECESLRRMLSIRARLAHSLRRLAATAWRRARRVFPKGEAHGLLA